MKTKQNRTHAPIRVIECGSCGHFHRVAFAGDCRQDSERFADIQDAATRLGHPVIECFEDGPMSGTPVYPAKAVAP
jgi:isopentenyl phosphate kinase